MTKPPGELPDCGEQIRQEARELVYGEKADAYGDPATFFKALSKKVGQPDWWCCAFMVLFKLTRLQRQWTPNDARDYEGYKLILEEHYGVNSGLINGEDHDPNALPLSQGRDPDDEETTGN